MLQSSRTVMFSAFGMVTPNEKRLRRVVETELFFRYQLEKDTNDERLGVAADAEVVGWSERHFLFQIGRTEGADEAASFVIPDADQRCWNRRLATKAFAIVFDGCHDRGLHRRVHD